MQGSSLIYAHLAKILATKESLHRRATRDPYPYVTEVPRDYSTTKWYLDFKLKHYKRWKTANIVRY